MKTQDEFLNFVDAELSTELSTVNKQRKGTLKMFFLATFICVAFVGFMIYSSMGDVLWLEGENTLTVIAFVFIALYGIGFSISYFVKKNKSNATPNTSSGYGFAYDFKDKVVRRMVEFLDPSFKYQIVNHIKLSEVIQSGMFHESKLKASGSDLVQGVEDGVPFKFSDLRLVREKTFVGKNEDTEVSVFSGSMFIAEFNKSFKKPVYVFSKKALGIVSSELSYTGDKVRLEDPDFDKQFAVYSPDQIEARFILTPSMMERLKALRRKMGNNVNIVFANNNIYIANNNGKDRFEIGALSSVNRRESIIGYYNDLAEQLGIIDELKLNLKIWKA
ncbi:MAG: DUF3137 domain-containing protein [Prevotellaceae bacterium]|jgi:hypothetical protein|nr:DUF3137 domain-containing protein [Prevotellaceae bacterium]